MEAKNIFLIGETGNGKSSLGNLILDWNAFEVKDDPNLNLSLLIYTRCN